MSSAHFGAILRQLRKQAAAWEEHELPDHELLERFARGRDEAAFAVLLRRHGSMVLGVCRNVLHDLHDAEDAFQAAFLLLAQKAGSIHRREAVSGWLYRVAYHLALRAGCFRERREWTGWAFSLRCPADRERPTALAGAGGRHGPRL